MNGMIKLYDLKSIHPVDTYLNQGGCNWDSDFNQFDNQFITANDDGFLRLFQID